MSQYLTKSNEKLIPQIALVIRPCLRSEAKQLQELRLAETKSLVSTIGLKVSACEAVRMDRFTASSLLGTGKIAEIGIRISNDKVVLVVVDGTLTPLQQRTLEKHWSCKVIDRTGLILEIFGARAKTSEGKLQVELAALTYQRSRLVRSWTHLERQRGGVGFLGGPGEAQLESDRRQIDVRIKGLKQSLSAVKRTRSLHRKGRKRVPYPIIALVGYTNAGKSTLFNQLTGADVLVADKLFATLDPKMRAARLPSGREVIYSDTVGFVSELPTTLIAAFRATLEEVVEADLIVHVRDMAHTDNQTQRSDVLTVLGEILPQFSEDDPPLEALNKVDLVSEQNRRFLAQITSRKCNEVALSAKTGKGCYDLQSAIDRRLSKNDRVVDIRVDLKDGNAIAWLYANGSVLDRKDDDSYAYFRVSLTSDNHGRFQNRTNSIETN